MLLWYNHRAPYQIEAGQRQSSVSTSGNSKMIGNSYFANSADTSHDLTLKSSVVQFKARSDLRKTHLGRPICNECIKCSALEIFYPNAFFNAVRLNTGLQKDLIKLETTIFLFIQVFASYQDIRLDQLTGQTVGISIQIIQILNQLTLPLQKPPMGRGRMQDFTLKQSCANFQVS